MKKIEIMPQVVVYRDILSNDDIDFLMNEIRQSEKDIVDLETTSPEMSAYFDKHGHQPEKREDGSLIYTWTPWYTFGMRSIWSEPSSKVDQRTQAAGYWLIKNAVVAAHNDYLIKWKDSGRWTYDIKDWDVTKTDDEDDSDHLFLSTMEILKHKIETEREYNIGIHTDWHDHRSSEPGPKQILTYTIYLNDNYDGGEINFIDEEGSKAITYKPKRGDITVFPSGKPYWHGAKAVTSGENKIFIRTFSIYKSRGTKEWMREARNNGATRWVEMENERIKKFIDEGNVGRQLVLPGQEENLSLNTLPLYISTETYIDGREI